MAIVRWDPFWNRSYPVGLGSIQHRMNRLFDSFSNSVDDEDRTVVWSPRVEVTEVEDHYEVTAELPGMNREDVKVELNNDVLTISGEKNSMHEKKDRTVHLCERTYGSFSRSFQLPNQIDAGKIVANFKDGILTLSLPKIEEAKPKQIEIKVA